MPSAQDIIKTALGEVGVTEYPPNSNRCKYNQAFYNGKDVSGSQYPWCCAFVWWVFAQYDPCLVKKTASCQDLGNWFNAQGRWHSNPEIGDVVFFHFSTNDRWTNHVGIVKDIKGNMIETIEGNTSISSDDNGGAVMVRQRTSNIVGYGRPDYSEKAVYEPNTGYIEGIDVSEYQNEIDFDQIQAAGIKLCACGQPKRMDPLTRHLNGICKSAWTGTLITAFTSTLMPKHTMKHELKRILSSICCRAARSRSGTMSRIVP